MPLAVYKCLKSVFVFSKIERHICKWDLDPDPVKVGPDPVKVGPDPVKEGPDPVKVGPDPVKVGPDPQYWTALCDNLSRMFH